MAKETDKTTWTRDDEARFAEMNERRARVIGVRAADDPGAVS
jgi:hypothetical protein